MSGDSAIAWTDKVWNPTIGCTRVSAGCDHCYAFQLHDQRHVAWKRGRMPSAPAQYHQPFSRVQLAPARLGDPLRWRKPNRVFVNSMSDLFHEDVPDAFLDRVWYTMIRAHTQTFQILTKRPERMRAYLADRRAIEDRIFLNTPEAVRGIGRATMPWPLPNVWLGVSAEDQAAADARIPLLLQTPAAVRFISAEPLLGPLDLRRYLPVGTRLEALDWVIVGGESGPHHRPMRYEWASAIREQCRAAGVSFFMKQDSGARPGMYDHLPDELKVREFPR